MNDLRSTILKRLSASTKEKPVNLDDLRNFTADVCTDLDELDEALDKLIEQRLINTVCGMSGGERYRCYWLTGTVNPAQPFNLTDRPQHTLEKTMPTPSELRTILIEIIGKQPGVKKPDLVKQALAKAPGSTAEKIDKTLGNLFHAAKLINKTGTRDLTEYTLKKAGKAIANKAKPASKGKKAAAKSTRPKTSKPETGVATKSALALVPAKQNDHGTMDYSFNLGGSFSIRKNGQAILLTPNEAMDLMQFGSQQIAMINQIQQGESA